MSVLLKWLRCTGQWLVQMDAALPFFQISTPPKRHFPIVGECGWMFVYQFGGVSPKPLLRQRLRANNGNSTTSAVILRCAVAFSVPTQHWLEEEKELVVGDQPCLTLPIRLWPPPPHTHTHRPLQAEDRLCGCGRADYRPVPLGSGCHSSSSTPFLSAGSEAWWRGGVGMHGGQG